jgi:hypothetical protein
MTVKFVIDKIIYLRSPKFPIFFFVVAAAAQFAAARDKFLTSGKALHPIVFISFSTGDTMLMWTTTNQRDNPNVKDQQRRTSEPRKTENGRS